MVMQSVVGARATLVFRIVVTRAFTIVAFNTSCYSFYDFFVRVELPALFDKVLHYILLYSRVAEAPIATVGLVKFVYFFPLGSLVFGDNHLGDTVSIVDNERLMSVIDKFYTDIATVI